MICFFCTFIAVFLNFIFTIVYDFFINIDEDEIRYCEDFKERIPYESWRVNNKKDDGFSSYFTSKFHIIFSGGIPYFITICVAEVFGYDTLFTKIYIAIVIILSSLLLAGNFMGTFYSKWTYNKYLYIKYRLECEKKEANERLKSDAEVVAVMTEIENVSSQLFGSVINNINIDMPKKAISLDLTTTANGKTEQNFLKIENCSSFLWLEKDEYAKDYDFSKCDYYELTSIHFEKTSANSEDVWLNNYPMEYNIAIEILETALLINATEITVNNKHFSIPQ